MFPLRHPLKSSLCPQRKSARKANKDEEPSSSSSSSRVGGVGSGDRALTATELTQQIEGRGLDLSDAVVAEMIAREAARASARTADDGVLAAFCRLSPAAAAAEKKPQQLAPNRRFLAATIRGTLAANRAQEERLCFEIHARDAASASAANGVKEGDKRKHRHRHHHHRHHTSTSPSPKRKDAKKR